MKHKGGSETKGGFYWKKGTWEIVTVEGKRGVLPGTQDAEYLRVFGIFLLPVALVLSIAYVVFLPLVGFAMVFHTLARKAAAHLRLPAGARAVSAEAGSAKGHRGDRS
jgi:hypothetical protein